MPNSIPQQSTGNSRDNEAHVQLSNETEARLLYNQARSRLLNVNSWKDFSGFFSADFTLTDGSGSKLEREPREGDYFRIKLPSPAPADEFDWVRIETIDEVETDEMQYTSMRVRPSEDPVKADSHIDHFFSDKATSNFTVMRKGSLVSAEVHGRNEQANVEHSGNITFGLRNIAVAAGALLGFSDFQWKKLVNGLLDIR